MSFLRRTPKDTTPEVNSEVAELGRDYAIARRHKDRKQMRQIMRKVERDHGRTDDTLASFEQGQRSYDEIPAIPTFKRRRRGR